MLPRTFLLSEERTHVETNFSSNQDIIFKRSPIGQELLQGKEAVYALERKGVFFFLSPLISAALVYFKPGSHLWNAGRACKLWRDLR